jgi:hypothetical protein
VSVTIPPDDPDVVDEKEREITEAYRRGYGEHPQEDWVGELGLLLWAELVKDEPPG